MGALLVLSLEGNCFCAEGGKALAAGLKGNQVITELNVSYNELCLGPRLKTDPSGITAIADAIPGMRAMTKIDVRGNAIGSEGKRALKKAAGVGFFGSRYVRLEFLSFYSNLK
jgi:Ran GTPase-activating protein (RanGAP) involved in mRNA processing and transport